jgi:hypothetical protein
MLPNLPGNIVVSMIFQFYPFQSKISWGNPETIYIDYVCGESYSSRAFSSQKVGAISFCNTLDSHVSNFLWIDPYF